MAFPPAKPKTKYDMSTQTHKVVKSKGKGKKPNPFAKKGDAPDGGNSYAPKQPF